MVHRWLHRAAFLLFLLPLLPSTGVGQASPPGSSLVRLEAAWIDLRNLHDEYRMTRSQGATISPRGRSLDELINRIFRARAEVEQVAGSTRPEMLDSLDTAAFGFIGEQLALLPVLGAANLLAPAVAEPDCRPAAFEAPPGTKDPLTNLTDLVFACYGRAAQRIVVEGDTLDRLTILGLMGRVDDRSRRERLFRALLPVWTAVNGDDSPSSPYRRMVALRLKQWGGGPTPMVTRARELGVEPDSLEAWLVRVLDHWRAALPDTLFEPWDFYYFNGEASRFLSPRIPRDSLLAINRRFYRSLGADPVGLDVHYDIQPRPGKYPVAFTDIARRRPMRAWVSASYRVGGFDNLGELLHETGHAIHISAITTRPAYADWPDSDTFTEAIADLAAMEMYEPSWQRRFLGLAAPFDASLRAKYSGIVLDMAWALFEIRVHRTPERSPNEIWTELTGQYLKIRPHPELSWWAMRGQLVESPGYMMNYAFGALLIADIRARLAAVRGPYTTGDSRWYSWVGTWLFRHGREIPSREVVNRFLERGVRPEALLADLARKGG